MTGDSPIVDFFTVSCNIRRDRWKKELRVHLFRSRISSYLQHSSISHRSARFRGLGSLPISADGVVDPLLLLRTPRDVRDLRVRGQSDVTPILLPGAGLFGRQRFVALGRLPISGRSRALRARRFANFGVDFLGLGGWCGWQGRQAVPDLRVRRIEIGTDLDLENARGNRALNLLPRLAATGCEGVRLGLETGVPFRRPHTDFRSYSECERRRFFRRISAPAALRYPRDSLDEAVVARPAPRVTPIANGRSLYVLETLLKALQYRLRVRLRLYLFKVQLLQLGIPTGCRLRWGDPRLGSSLVESSSAIRTFDSRVIN